MRDQDLHIAPPGTPYEEFDKGIDRQIPGLFGASPFRPVVMIVSKSMNTMESLYDWTYEELAQRCEDYDISFTDVWRMILQMRKDRSSLLYIDLDVYLEAKRKES